MLGLLITFLLPYWADASLSYQQTAHLSAALGYPKGPSFFTQQQGVLSKGPYNLSFQASCTDDSCQTSLLKAGYYPRDWRLDFGYLSRFHSATMTKKNPFFGLSVQYPNDFSTQPISPPAWQPWLGIRTTKSNQLSIRDATQTLFLGQVDPGYLLFASENLPSGSYPITITSTDEAGNQEQSNQFIAQPLYPNQQNETLLLNLGWPVGKTAQSNFGLPPIDNGSRNFMAFASYARKWPLGFLIANSGLSLHSWQLGLRNIFSASHVAFAPELLWQTGPSSAQAGYNLALGCQLTLLPTPHTATQISAYTYPSVPEEDGSTPSVVHTQLTYHRAPWQSYLTWHWSTQPDDGYWQTKLSWMLPSSPSWQYQVSVLGDKKSQHPHTTTLRVQASQKKPSRDQLSLLASSRLQTVRWSHRSSPNLENRVKIGRYAQPSGPHWQGSWRSTWATNQGNIHMYTGISQHSKRSIIWALEADTGISAADGTVAWHSLPSIWHSYKITLPATPTSRWFWWDTAHTQKPMIKRIKPYTPVDPEQEVAIEYTSHLAYPGNLIVKHLLT